MKKSLMKKIKREIGALGDIKDLFRLVLDFFT